MNGAADGTRRRLAADAPPTAPGPIPSRRAGEAWARVLGVISIVLGCTGIAGGAWNAVGWALAPRLLGWMPTDDAAAQAVRDSMARWALWQSAAGVAQVIAGGLLLSCGVGMVRRRRWSVRLAWAWIGLKLAVATGSALVTGLQQRDQLLAMARSGTPVPGTMSATMGAISAVVIWSWGVLYPGILGAWLARASVRRQVAGWR